MSLLNSAAPAMVGSANATRLPENGAPASREINASAQFPDHHRAPVRSALSMWGIRTPSDQPDASCYGDSNAALMEWGSLRLGSAAVRRILPGPRFVSFELPAPYLPCKHRDAAWASLQIRL